MRPDLSIADGFVPGAVFALFALAMLASAPALADDETPPEHPLEADAVNGARLYRLDCAACHGQTGWGDGVLAASLKPAPAALRDGGVLWSRSDDDLVTLVVSNTGMPAGAPVHGNGLSAMDVRDVLVWLRGETPSPAAFFANATQYIAHRQTLDKLGTERVEKVIGEPLTDAEKSWMVYTTYKSADGSPNPWPGHAVKIPEVSSALYEAAPSRKIGYVVYLPLALEGGTINVALAMNRNARLTVVRTFPAADEKTEALRHRVDAVLRTYVGSGGRRDKKPVEPQHGAKAPKDVQKAMIKAYDLLLESATMFDKEEHERFWSEPDALKVTTGDDAPSPVDLPPPLSLVRSSSKKHR